MAAPYRRLGKIVKAHGSRGEVLLALRDGLSPSQLPGLDVWVVPPPESGARARRLSELRPTPKGTIARISGVSDQGEAHELAGRYLLARGEETQAEPGEAEEFLGLDVVDGKRGFIGTVEDIIVTGANDVLVLGGGPFGEVLIPVIDSVIGEFDEDAGTLHVTLLEGLIEEEGAE